jgi:AAA15 family ATPase/GTPase
MLVRIYIQDLLSFHKGREFNMIPQPRFSRLKDHSYKINDTNILKMSAIYGPNGAGKSNLIEVLSLVQEIITDEDLPSNLSKYFFRLTKESVKPSVVIEFIASDKSYLYGLELGKNRIVTEELYESGLGKVEDKLIFERKTLDDESSVINFSSDFESVEENRVLKTVLQKNLIKKNKSVFKMLSELDNDFLSDTVDAYNWFSKSLRILMPDSKPGALPHLIDVDESFHDYAENIMCSFHVGVNSLDSIKIPIRDFFNNDEIIDRILDDLNRSESDLMGFRSDRGDEIVIVKENEEIFVKQIKIGHENSLQESFQFDIGEESDGTIRLMDFIPAFRDMIELPYVYVIDEIERSIHPLLIRELIDKFSKDSNTIGQLIFTTHESNLLDQSIFRQDEIWFVEKDQNGSSDMYSLSDYKEHNTKDNRKGY